MVDGPWTWLQQVHGAEVVVVDRPGGRVGAVGDAAVTATAGVVLAVHTADCAPVLLSDPVAGVIGVAHAGWQGAEAGVIEATVRAMTGLGGRVEQIEAVVGPCISPVAYEFSMDDLTRLALRHGPEVVAATSTGAPAFDLRAAVRSALIVAGVRPDAIDIDPRCTASAVDGGVPQFFSHRARGDVGRQASVIWMAS